MISIYEFADHYRQLKSISEEFQSLNINHFCFARSSKLVGYEKKHSFVKYIYSIQLYLMLIWDVLSKKKILIHTAPEYHSHLEKFVFLCVAKFFSPEKVTLIIRDLRTGKGQYLLKLKCRKLVENERLYEMFMDQVSGYIYPTVSISGKQKLKQRSSKNILIGIPGSYNHVRRDYQIIEKLLVKFYPDYNFSFKILGSNYGMPQNLLRQLKLEDKGFDPPYITDKIYTERLESVDLLLLLNKFENYEYKGTGVIGDAFQFCLPIISLDQRFCMHSEDYIFHISEFKEIKYAKLLEWQDSRKTYFQSIIREISKN